MHKFMTTIVTLGLILHDKLQSTSTLPAELKIT